MNTHKELRFFFVFSSDHFKVGWESSVTRTSGGRTFSHLNPYDLDIHYGTKAMEAHHRQTVGCLCFSYWVFEAIHIMLKVRIETPEKDWLILS